jgi:ABC-type amino acid transport substrate-binding protein/nitrogen-specific signal transduction histidine kinase
MKKIILLIVTLSLLNINLHAFAEEIVYKVAGDNNFPPYEYVDSDGVYKGFNVDIMKAISFTTGIKFKYIPMKWENAYNSIEKGKADIIQGMKESEERKTKFSFTDSLFMNSQSVFVKSNTYNIKSEIDLIGKTVAIMREDSVYNQISKISQIKIIEYDSVEESLQSLLDHKVDALIANTLTVNYLCNENNSTDLVKIVGNSLNEKKYAIAVEKDNTILLNQLNEGLKEIQENGMYDIIYRKWFGAPIKNSREQYELYMKIVIYIFISMLVIILIIYSINKRLNKIIEKKTEEQKVLMAELREYDKMQFMDKIISSIAHEIRNPLTSIKIYTGQMKDKIENKEFMIAAAEDIPAEIDRIDKLIKEFIEYTSPRKPLICNLNLHDEVISSIKLVKLQINNIKLSVNIDKSYYIKFDINHFKQIVINIILNSKDAVKDTQDPIIEIFAEEKDNEILLYFKDNGYGMNEKDIQYIFEPFFTTKSHGNGVGMFVVKQMVEDNGGNIIAVSEGEMKGMCIILTAKKGNKGDTNER